MFANSWHDPPQRVWLVGIHLIMSFIIQAQKATGIGSSIGGDITINGQGREPMSKEKIALLLRLARRQHPETNCWAYWSEVGYVCLICDQLITGSIDLHAETHLKESNLLPFL